MDMRRGFIQPSLNVSNTDLELKVMAEPPTKTKIPIWFWAVSGLGLAWNIFGIVQFLGAVTATTEGLTAKGMTASQAAVYMSIPVWMNVAFALGVFGGVIGSVLLIVRKPVAVPVFAASLAGYLVLYAGDIIHGVFAALGTQQVVILSSVVAIAAILLWSATHGKTRGYFA
jgi:hypothetical protein